MTESHLTEYVNSVCDDLKRTIVKARISFLRWMAVMLLIQAAFIIALIKLL